MSAGYDPALPGLDEARLDAYRELLVSKLDLLNIVISRDDRAPIGLVTPAMVEIGDPETIWDPAAGAIRIRVTGGDESELPDFESELTMGVVCNVGFKYTFQTHISVYLHPDAFAALPIDHQAEARERALSRINDWITLGVCNNWDPNTDTGGLVVTLGSHVLTPAPGYDALLDSHVWRGYRSWQFRGFAHSEMLPALHLVVQASVE
jgi:hypothetical protein